MKRGLSTALAVASLLNLWAADPFAQAPSQMTTTATQPAPPPEPQTTTPSPQPQPPPAQPQGGKVIIHAATGGKTKHRRHKSTRLKAAGDPGVTIKDFSYGPSSVTVHVGDTVSWSNAGPSAHTATANNGSFDTGTLNKGQSGSHTFSTAGTFAYHCTLHPFMHGTIVVVAAAGSSTGSSSSKAAPATKPGTTTTTPTQTKSALPNTGVDVGSLLLSGVLMLGAGLLLRRRAAQS
jgi:LPXTG-motif cell wall-anchored protein